MGLSFMCRVSILDTPHTHTQIGQVRVAAHLEMRDCMLDEKLMFTLSLAV